MSIVLGQELSAAHEAWLRPPPAYRSPAAALSVGTASSWRGVMLPTPMISAMGQVFSDATRVRPVLTTNTGWSAHELRTLVLLYPFGSVHGLIRHADTPLLLDYDLLGARNRDVAHGQQDDPGLGEPSTPQTALADISAWTGLSTSRLGVLLGVARRSLYNWLDGRPLSPDMQRRLERLHRLLAQVAEHHDPEGTREWLDAGEPSNFELLGEQNWELAHNRLAQLAPLRARRVDETDLAEARDTDSLSPVARRAVLAQFASSPRVHQGRSGDAWSPQELTGAIPFDDEDESD